MQIDSIELNWTGSGYASVSGKQRESVLGGPEANLWATWFDALMQAKAGDFSHIPQLVAVHRETRNWILGSMCADLLGDAGTRSSFSLILEAIPTADNIIARIDYCEILAIWGRLSEVPLILKTFLSIQHFEDADIIPVHLSDLLEPLADAVADPNRFATINAYVDFVTTEFEELKQKLGTDQIFVYRGEQLSVVRLAKLILAAIYDDTFDYQLRRKFEAFTGIDCATFYFEGKFQPLAAAAIVEDFLESPDVAKYRDGVRYFFGHPIPD